MLNCVSRHNRAELRRQQPAPLAKAPACAETEGGCGWTHGSRRAPTSRAESATRSACTLTQACMPVLGWEQVCALQCCQLVPPAPGLRQHCSKPMHRAGSMLMRAAPQQGPDLVFMSHQITASSLEQGGCASQRSQAAAPPRCSKSFSTHAQQAGPCSDPARRASGRP